MTDEGKHGRDHDPKPEGPRPRGKRGWRDRVAVAQDEGFAYVSG
jgi:hypothetical protein